METIDERVSVNLLNDTPTELVWRNRHYTITNIGLRHTVYQGRVLIHVFSVTDGGTYFKLHFNTETLVWKLLEVADAM